MRLFTFTLSMAVVVLLGDGVSGGDKKQANKEKLVGTWEVVKVPEGWKYITTTVPPKSTVTMEFTKDNKLKFLAKSDDAAVSLHDTYSVEGDKITINQKQGDKDVAWTMMITKLTDKELVVDVKDGDKATKMEFKKK